MDILAIAKDFEHRLSNIWVQVNRVDEVHCRIRISERRDRPTHVLKTLSKVLAAVARD